MYTLCKYESNQTIITNKLYIIINLISEYKDRSCTATKSKETMPNTKAEEFDIEIIDTS